MTLPNLAIRLAVIGLLSACSTLSPFKEPSPVDQAVAACKQYYRDVSTVIKQNGVNDAQSTPVAGYPYLHVNRFLVGLIPILQGDESRRLWITLAARLALETHTIEINNLPASASAELSNLTPEHLTTQPPHASLQKCSSTLLHHTLKSTHMQQHIQQTAKVPDDYHTWKRIVGLYPLVSFPVALGIKNWHQQSTAALQTPLDTKPVHGELLRYSTDTQLQYTSLAEVTTALHASRQNALALPLPDAANLQRLFATFAPLFEVDTLQNDDNPGAPEWPAEGVYAKVDSSRPTVYTLASHALFNGEILLQLNYIVWFPARPCTSSWDFLCGHMDGLIWRVTLGGDGIPIIYDSVHNCGCYHTFFPTAYIQPKPPPPVTVDSRPSLDERAFVPLQAPSVAPGQHLVLRIAHRTHHIESLYIADVSQYSEAVPMTWTNYDALRSLPFPGQDVSHKSLFAPDGLVAGTQRKERWFFWPLGVPSAGAMRQWGNHATAFIGRRHFDEPYLLDNAFSPAWK